MNICILCRNIHKDLGGIESFVREYSYALATNGHNVHIIAQDVGNLYKQSAHRNITLHDLKLKEKPFLGFWFIDSFFPIEEMYFSFMASKCVKILTKSIKFDIIEIMDYFRQGTCLALNKRYPLFLRLHGWMFNKAGYWKFNKAELALKEKFQRYFLQICLNKADGIAAVSQSFADYASNAWNVPLGKLSIIHNAVNTEKYNPGPPNSRENALIFSSRMLKNKGVIIFVDALKEILKKFPTWKVYFAGSDQNWPEDKITAKKYIVKNLPTQNLIFLGSIPAEEVIRYYRQCKISVLPSLYEPFGLSALEAMACGCAIIASKSGGLTEFIDDKQTGLLVEPNNPEELAQAIETFILNEKFRETCASNGADKVKKEFTYKHLIDSSLKAYEEAINHYQNT